MAVMLLALLVVATAAVSHSTEVDTVELHVGDGQRFASLHEARDYIRSQRRMLPLLGSAHGRAGSEAAPVRVAVHAGVHPPLQLSGALDSNVSWVAAAGEPPPLLSAGISVPRTAFRPWPQREGSLVANLTAALGLRAADMGAMPDAGSPVQDCDQAECNHWQETGCTPGGKVLLYHDDAELPLLLARWPNVLQSDEGRRKKGDWDFARVSEGMVVAPPYIEGFYLDSTRNAAAAERVYSWHAEERPHVHGYWAADWSDVNMRVGNITRGGVGGNTTLFFKVAGHGMNPKPGARFFGTNLLTELDVPGEYFISTKDPNAVMLYYMPASPANEWRTEPVLSRSAYALHVRDTVGVTVQGMRLAFGRTGGVFGPDNHQLNIVSCTIDSHGGHAVLIPNGTEPTVEECDVRNTGCAGIRVHAGVAHTLTPGRASVKYNRVRQWGNLKRTYQPAVHWGGVENSYSYNDVADGPHVCFWGGGNAVDGVGPWPDAGAVSNTFEGNTFERCAFETADAAAFYTCGQSGQGQINPGNILRNNTFRAIRNTTMCNFGGGQKAVYLDDTMSGWTVVNNTFEDCDTGLALCGGRDNTVVANRFNQCTTPLYFDNRGMTNERPKWRCDLTCDFNTSETGALGGSCAGCPPAGPPYELRGPAGKEWARRWPRLEEEQTDPRCWSTSSGMAPCNNNVSANVYCGSAPQFVTFGGLGPNTTAIPADWSSVVAGNTRSCGDK